MLAYTGVETVSNLAEEARDPVRTVPAAYKLVAGAVFAIYFTLPLVALSALPVETIDGELTTLLALPPEEGGYANDPILGVVENLGLEGLTLDVAEIYVGVLAATILFIATNAGVIGASRITYSMASYRQLPERLRTLHPRFKTPWLSLVLFAGIAPILLLLPGDVNFIGTLYSLGATLSFTVAHAALIRLRMLDRDGVRGRLPRVPEPPRRRSRLAALRDRRRRSRPGASFLVLVVQNATTRWVGLGWMVLGLIGYVVYRRRFVRASLGEIVKAPPAFGPALALEYRRILVPVVPGKPSDEAARPRLPPRGRARLPDRRGDGDRDAARPAARRRGPRARVGSRTASSTRPWRSATRTACRSSAASSGHGPPARRSWPRPRRGRPRSSSSARGARS